MIYKKEQTVFNLIIFLLVISNLNIIPLFYKVSHPFLTNKTTSFIHTISAVNKYLPKNERISFLTTVEPEKVFIDKNAVKKFFLTQYAIVPRILDNNVDNKYLIGIFDNLKNEKIYISKKFEIYKVINKDIIIFKRKDANLSQLKQEFSKDKAWLSYGAFNND